MGLSPIGTSASIAAPTRIIHLVLLGMVAICFYTCYRDAPVEHQISPVLVSAIAFVCLNDLGVAIFLRNRTVRPSVERLLANSDDESALKQWQKGVILTLTMAFTTVLFGVTLKFMGAGWNTVSWFFAVGGLVILAWAPKLDIPTAN